MSRIAWCGAILAALSNPAPAAAEDDPLVSAVTVESADLEGLGAVLIVRLDAAFLLGTLQSKADEMGRGQMPAGAPWTVVNLRYSNPRIATYDVVLQPSSPTEVAFTAPAAVWTDRERRKGILFGPWSADGTKNVCDIQVSGRIVVDAAGGGGTVKVVADRLHAHLYVPIDRENTQAVAVLVDERRFSLPAAFSLDSFEILNVQGHVIRARAHVSGREKAKLAP